MFGNQSHSAAMEEFLRMLGRKIPLAEHRGYRGGLDTQYGQTGEQGGNSIALKKGPKKGPKKGLKVNLLRTYA